MAKAAKKRTKRPAPKPVNKVKDAAIPSPENITEMATKDTGTGATTTTDTPDTPNPTPPEATTTTKGGTATGEAKATYVVADGKTFRDKNDFSKEYKAGDEVNHFDQTRLADLVSKGLVKKA